jgi:hypothetical protein
MKKALVVATITAMITSTAVTTMAADYDNHWAKNAITEWVTYGVVGGYEDGSFKPNNNVTKAELASFITRVFGLTDKKTATLYADVDDAAWYKDAVTKVTAAGIMTGTNSKFNPNAAATREEAAAALAAAFSLTETGSKTFKDADAISEWAKDGVLALAAGGYISGRPNGNFDPKANLTRAEFISMLDKVTEVFANKAGTYTGAQDGNVVVNTTDVELKDMTISDNLYLAQGIGTGDVTLNNVTVEGETIIAGGGINSIKMTNCNLKKGATIVAKQAVRVVSEGSSSISIVAAEGTTVVLTGTFTNVQVPAGVKVEFKGATVASITVVASASNPDAKATIVADEASTIKKIEVNAAADVTGKGKIEEAVVNVGGFKSETAPAKSTIKEGVTANLGGKTIDSTGKPVSAGGGGGGGGGGSTPVAQAIKITEITLYNGDTKVFTKAVADNTITLSEAEMTGEADAEVDGIGLALNVAAGKELTVSYANALTPNDEVFLVKDKYPLAQFIGFGEKNKELLIAKAESLAVAIVGADKAEEYVSTKIAQLEELTGVSLDDLYPADGKANIGNTIAMLDKVYDTYTQTPGQQEILDILLAAMGITVDGDTYTVKATLKSTGFSDAAVIINLVK